LIITPNAPAPIVGGDSVKGVKGLINARRAGFPSTGALTASAVAVNVTPGITIAGVTVYVL